MNHTGLHRGGNDMGWIQKIRSLAARKRGEEQRCRQYEIIH